MKQNIRSGLFIFLGFMHAFTALSQVTATVVKDIRPGSSGSQPKFLTMYNNEIYFSAIDGVHGRELWKTDGTEAGTVMLKDIRPGSAASDPEWLTVSNGILYFSANDGVNGGELWRSDGTAAGTTMVTDLTPTGSTYPFSLADVGGVLYFAISISNPDPIWANRGLWKSDGTAAGTVKVAVTYSNSVSSGYVRPTNLTNANGAIYFIGEWPSLPTSTTLWKSDGTGPGTVMVSTNVSRFPYGIQPAYLTALNSDVYFYAKIDAEGGGGLWKSDGTEAGTVMVKDMDNSSTNGGVQFLRNINGTLYFAGFAGGSNNELWKSDGTGAGTVFVKEINPGSFGSNPSNFTAHNGMVYFVANTAAYGDEIWKTDGTEAGTTLVADLYPGASSTVSNVSIADKALITLNGNLYFRGYQDDGLGEELYKLNETILPVKWEKISVDCNSNLPRLTWKTATEVNTKDFVVQISMDALNWVNADTIAAGLNSSALLSYQYIGDSQQKQYPYFRIMQRDVDGRVNFSPVLRAACDATEMQVSLFPNPAGNTIHISGITDREVRGVEVLDMSGKRVLLLENHKSMVDISRLSKGAYILNLVKKDGSAISRRFIKQ